MMIKKSPLTVVQAILLAYCSAVPYTQVKFPPVSRFIIAYLYGFALVIMVSFKRIGERARSMMLWLYFLSWAALIAFDFLFVDWMSGCTVIFFPIIFWLFIYLAKELLKSDAD